MENFDWDLIFGKEQEEITFIGAKEGPVSRLLDLCDSSSAFKCQIFCVAVLGNCPYSKACTRTTTEGLFWTGCSYLLLLVKPLAQWDSLPCWHEDVISVNIPAVLHACTGSVVGVVGEINQSLSKIHGRRPSELPVPVGIQIPQAALVISARNYYQ